MKITGVSGIRDNGELVTIELSDGDVVHLDRNPNSNARHSIVISSQDTLFVDFNGTDADVEV